MKSFTLNANFLEVPMDWVGFDWIYTPLVTQYTLFRWDNLETAIDR